MPQSPPDLARPTTKTVKESREIFGRRHDADDATLIVEIALRDLSVRVPTIATRQAPVFICLLLEGIGPCGVMQLGCANSGRSDRVHRLLVQVLSVRATGFDFKRFDACHDWPGHFFSLHSP